MKRFSRRQLLGILGTGAVAGAATPWVRSTQSQQNHTDSPVKLQYNTSATAHVFSLSVMSGDPSPSGVVLWTRIAPSAYQQGKSLFFQVAQDARFAETVLEGDIDAREIGPEHDYTIQVDLDGQLQADTRYYYRFIYDGTTSRTGRCRTTPAPDQAVQNLCFGVITCQDYTNGYYGAFRSLGDRDDIDWIIHLGDFIYESAGDPRFQSLPFEDRCIILPSNTTVALDLADYRHIYRTYRSDLDFQHCLEQHTFIQIWDDHEIANDCYWDATRDTLGAPDHPYTKDPEYGNDPALLRRLAIDARQAWREYVPARVPTDFSARHPHELTQIYRSFRFGNLTELFLTDERSYRSPHPCGEEELGGRYTPIGCKTYKASDQTMLGEKQRDWLLAGALESNAQWKVWGNEVLMTSLSLGRKSNSVPLLVDGWDGFQTERKLIAEALHQNKEENLVVLSGDLHTSVVAHLKIDYDKKASPFIATEFMTTSLTSAGLTEQAGGQFGSALSGLPSAVGQLVRGTNPHIVLFDTSHQGYAILEITPEKCLWDIHAVDKNTPDGAITDQRLHRYERTSGNPLVRESTAPVTTP